METMDEVLAALVKLQESVDQVRSELGEVKRELGEVRGIAETARDEGRAFREEVRTITGRLEGQIRGLGGIVEMLIMKIDEARDDVRAMGARLDSFADRLDSFADRLDKMMKVQIEQWTSLEGRVHRIEERLDRRD